jgi:hypothetical protein
LAQVFPDEYHLATLETVLGVLAKLEAEVDVKALVASFITRLLRFLTSSSARDRAAALPAGLDVFAVFLRYCSEIVEVRPAAAGAGTAALTGGGQTRSLPWPDVFALAASLLNLALGMPEQTMQQSLEVTDRALGFALDVMRKRKLDKCARNARCAWAGADG